MMLEVLELVDRIGVPEVGGDWYVPLMVKREITASVIWHALDPEDQLCCEIMISKSGGRIDDITVLHPPLVTTESEQGSSVWEEDGSPVVSLVPFDLNPDLIPRQKLVEVYCSPTAVRVGEWLEIRFNGTRSNRWARSGAVGYGIDETSKLVAVRVLSASIPPESPLATNWVGP